MITSRTIGTGPDLVCFDLDGVLVDTRIIHWQALNDTFTDHGFPTLTWEQHLPLDGLPTKVKLDRLNLPGWLAEPKQEHTARLLDQLPCDDRKRALIARLSDAGWTVAVVSNAVRATVLGCVNRLGLTVDLIVSNEDCAHPKPNPSPYLTAMARAGIGPAHTAVIEDRDVGVQSAVAAGVRTVVQVADTSEVDCEHLDPDGGRRSPLRRGGVHRP